MATQALQPYQPGQAAVVRLPATDKLSNTQRLGALLAASGYFSDAREAAQAAVKVMAGEELGVPPIASMMGINIIKGKIALGGNLIASRIRAHGYDYRIMRLDHTGCVLRFFAPPDIKGHREALNPDVEFNESDAQRAGVLQNDTYKKYPRPMYFNRAISMGARLHTPEIFGGAPVYTPEELGALVDDQGDLVSREVAPQTAVHAESLPDIGPHPMNTQAAANYVRDQKLAEIRREQEQQPKPDQATKPETKPETPDVPAEVAEMFKVMVSQKLAGFAKVFQGFNDRLSELLGAELGTQDYLHILGLHGVDSYQKFRSLATAKKCVLALYAKVQALTEQARVGPQPDVTDEEPFGEQFPAFPEAS